MKCAICEEREEAEDVGGAICVECWREGYSYTDGLEIRYKEKTVQQVKDMLKIHFRQQEQLLGEQDLRQKANRIGREVKKEGSIDGK